MEFKIQKIENKNVHRYPTEDLKIAQVFAQGLKNELGDFLMGVILFGSSVRREATPKSDIDILVISDDTQFEMSEALIEAYRIIVEKLIVRTSPKLHITSMTFTSFWEYAKAGDPVVVNILRDGVALMDTGFFEPLQILLKKGRIRPSEESIWRYFGRAPRTLLNSRWHLLQATLDLYWAVIDAAHAALMRAKEVPPTPDHVAEMLDKVFVKNHLLEKKYSEIMRKFYHLSKMITHREIKEIKGAAYDNYYKEADDFVKRMKKLIERGKF
ncbi:MAG: nucleotidyltransferase domain-containing protein [Nanoarchaeota archaeon]|nr:nucleotidyltransferase domain-containing protein [Nanoarchaeota archaeon]MBU1632663.1 nucleotidyltransferase domain-containing protein [Nanoarchaeota archaeon]MBU1875573.1 nucleotidyltransferase domain-containing protein [Nanoarchaeota archaeon]